MKHVDQLTKDKTNAVSEDQGRDAKAEIDELTKKHTKTIDEHTEKKAIEVEEI